MRRKAKHFDDSLQSYSGKVFTMTITVMMMMTTMTTMMMTMMAMAKMQVAPGGSACLTLGRRSQAPPSPLNR